jgi:hypothetical protein
MYKVKQLSLLLHILAEDRSDVGVAADIDRAV